MGPNRLQSRRNLTLTGVPAIFPSLEQQSPRCKERHGKAGKTRFLSKSLSKSLFTISFVCAARPLTVALVNTASYHSMEQEQITEPDHAGVFFLGLPFGQPPFLALRRAAAALARLVARPACAARTLPMSAPHLGHFSLLIRCHCRPCACVRHVRLRGLSGEARSAELD